MRGARVWVVVAGLVVSACQSSTTPSTTSTTTDTTIVSTPKAFTLAVTGQSVLTGLRQRSQVMAVATFDDGTSLDVTKTSTWVSSDTTVAVITPSGVLTTIAPGTVRVSCTYQSQTDGFDLTVSPVTTTFEGVLSSSDGQSGTFTLAVLGDVVPTSLTTSSEVSGTVRLAGATMQVTGFFEAVNGATTFSGVGAAYRFSAVVTAGALSGTFSAPGGVTGAIASVSATRS